MTFGRAERAVLASVAALGLIGFALSFKNVAAAVEPSFGYAAPLVPIGIDLGIAAFTGLDLLMAMRDRRTRWLRLFPWLLIAATIYLNIAGETDQVGRVAHGVLPLLWVVLVEAVAHWIRAEVGLTRAAERMDRIRVSRWILAPVSTVRLWRDMVLWEIRDYSTALARKQDAELAVCDLAESYGWLWRWKAPRRERVLLRQARLAPAHVEIRAAPAAGTRIAPPAQVETPNGNGHHPTPAPAPAPARERSPKEAAPEIPDIRTAARVIAEEHKIQEKNLSRRALIEGLRAQGFKVGTTRADRLLADLKDGAHAS